MISSILQLREMIPLYVNGSLPDEQVIEFEKGLQKHPELQQELDEFSAINATLDDVDMPDDEQFAELFKQIDSNINQQAQSFSSKEPKDMHPKDPSLDSDNAKTAAMITAF